MSCNVCGLIDEYYDENADINHEATPKHLCNIILKNYNNNKKYYSANRNGLSVVCNGESEPLTGATTSKTDENVSHQKIRFCVKPNQGVKFSFNMRNDMKNDDALIVGVQLAHPQPQFQMKNNPFIFGQDPYLLKKKSSILEDVTVHFKSNDIGTYEMPIMFTFYKPNVEENVIIIREMVVNVQENPIDYVKYKSPYRKEEWDRPRLFIPSTGNATGPIRFKIPTLLKILLPRGLEDNALEGLKVLPEILQKLRVVLVQTRAILDEGITKDNYTVFFHHLLWWEEIIQKINLRKYNMSGVTLVKSNDIFILEVPGLAEKRPSLLRGDRVYIRPKIKITEVFECTIKEIKESHIHLTNIDESFTRFYDEQALFDVRFIMSRVPIERMHEAIHKIYTSGQECRVFPEPTKKVIPRRSIEKFYNELIKSNPEQRCAVEHIVSGTSGTAPYIVFGPPGTGKTMTIVEAIIQLVVKNPRNRIMVCTESNMAADHIALMLLRFNKQLNINNFLVRANSQNREWKVLPPELAGVSNGTTFENFYSLSNNYIASYRIVVTTLMHAAKYAMERSQTAHRLEMSHVFVDEAAQAGEAAALVPITGLLRRTGGLVLAGDPRQLGPVCISRAAAHRGLGRSLMERLYQTYPNLYDGNPSYITMLVKNFRSHPDILSIPNDLFYDGQLQACAQLDPLSETSILGKPGGQRALVFHGVHSREQKMGNSPSFYNEKELDMLKTYVKTLISKHNVEPKDIGIISPYIRQVYKMRSWLNEQRYDAVEVGTVEAFQGKEKRVILVSTVRANCKLLDHDAKYSLGFLVEDKRYNVALTRAKSKLIMIGNPTCLTRDLKWRKFMELCKEFNCYYGEDAEQLPRTSAMLIEVARTRFERCKLSVALAKVNEEKNVKQKGKRK